MNSTDILAEAPLSSSGSKGKIVMLTLDRQIDRRILLEADSLEADGWNVSIISMPCDKHEETIDPRIYRIQQGGAEESFDHVHKKTWKLSIYNLARKILSPNYRLVQALRAFVRVYLFDSVGFYSELYLEELSHRNFDVVVAHDLPMLPIAVAAARENNASIVYDSHELFVEQRLPKYEVKGWQKIEEKNIRRGDAGITLNQSIANELKNRYRLQDVLVVHNAERVCWESNNGSSRLLHKKLALKDDARIVLLQGGLYSDRNLEVLVRAVALLMNRNIHLVFLGNGNGVPILKDLVSKLGLEKIVHFIPAVPQEELLSHTMSADLGVIPYLPDCLNNYYCTPNKLFEFVSAGLPIIASDLPEIRKIVAGNSIGYVVDFSSEGQIAASIEKMLSSEDIYQTFKSQVLELRKTLNWQNEGRKIVDLYRNFARNR